MKMFERKLQSKESANLPTTSNELNISISEQNQISKGPFEIFK